MVHMIYLILTALIGVKVQAGCGLPALGQGGTLGECSCVASDSTQTNCAKLESDITTACQYSSCTFDENIVCDPTTSLCTSTCADSAFCETIATQLGDDRTYCGTSSDGSTICQDAPDATQEPAADTTGGNEDTGTTEEPAAEDPTETDAPNTDTTSEPSDAATTEEAAGLTCGEIDADNLVGTIQACTCTTDAECTAGILALVNMGLEGEGFVGEILVCDTYNGHCSLSCNDESSCALAEEKADLAAGYLVCSAIEGPVCRIDGLEPPDGWTVPTEAPDEMTTTEDPDCTQHPAFPPPLECIDDEDIDCAIKLSLSVDICHVDLQMRVWQVQQSARHAIRNIANGIEDSDVLCEDADLFCFKFDATLTEGDADLVEYYARHTPHADDCLNITVCDDQNIQVDIGVSLRCGDCQDLWTLTELLKDKLDDGSAVGDFDVDALELSRGYDDVCGFGFGRVALQSPVTVTIVDQNGDEWTQEVVISKAGGRRGFVMVVVIAVLSLFY